MNYFYLISVVVLLLYLRRCTIALVQLAHVHTLLAADHFHEEPTHVIDD